VAVIVALILGLSLWYLTWPRPLIVQGEVDSTRIDMAARVTGRIGRIAVVRAQNVPAGAVLVDIDNPELLAQYQEAQAAQRVAEAELARINAGTRQEVVAIRKAEIDRAQANLTLARQTFDRTSRLATDGFSPRARLDEASDALEVAERGVEQAKLAYAEATAGFTVEEHGIAEAKVKKATATVATLKALVDQLVVTAPVAAQIYQIPTEPGEFVLPGVPLLSLVALDDTWVRFDLREDLMRGVAPGTRFTVRLPALGDRLVPVEVKVVAAKGEYAGWRATRATGDFDLRTFEIRAWPTDKVPELRPGMSAYADWQADRQ
jgi:HlyD family secretion protein